MDGRRLPRIEILARKPPGASARATAFADPDRRVIYLVASEPPFSIALAAQVSTAECRDPEALKMVASVIVHEEWHLRHGRDERGAYDAQLMTLHLLGLGPGTGAYRNVRLAMQAVVR